MSMPNFQEFDMGVWGEMKRANLIDEFTEILNYKASYNIVLQELYVLEFFCWGW